MRKDRIVIPGLPHHVMMRGNNRRRLFSYPRDYLFFIRLLLIGLPKTRCALSQLTLMKNHVHMVITPPEQGSLPHLAHFVGQQYATHRNRLYGGSGKLFEGRYRRLVIKNDKQLAATIMYNDANAFRAGIVPSPELHPWSTCALHQGRPEGARIPVSLWTPSLWYKSLGHGDARAGAYCEALTAYLASDPNGHGIAQPDVSVRDRGRVQRPNGSSARESHPAYGGFAKIDS